MILMIASASLNRSSDESKQMMIEKSERQAPLAKKMTKRRAKQSRQERPSPSVYSYMGKEMCEVDNYES